MAKVRVAWFTPEGDSGSISQYFSETILPILKKKFSEKYDIQIFSDNFITSKHFLTAVSEHKKKPFDIFFYQLEDRKSSNFVRIHLGIQPGIVYFHDSYFTTFGPEPILNSPWKDIVCKSNSKKNNWPIRNFEHYQKGPFAYRESAFAGVSVFSSEHQRIEYNRLVEDRVLGGEDKRSYLLPLPGMLATDAIKSSSLKIAYAGKPEIPYRVHKILQAISETENMHFNWLIEKSEETQARELLKAYDVSSFKLFTERSVDNWSSVLSESDIAIHTLFSAFGQLGPYIQSSLISGKPSILTNFASGELYSEKIVFKVQPGNTESMQIREILKTLEDEGLRKEISEKVKSFANEFYNPEVIASELNSIFDNELNRVMLLNKNWNNLRAEARTSLIKEAPKYIGDENVWSERYKEHFQELGWL